MINIKRLAAIDIGSNAARLLISNIIEKENGFVEFKKAELIRVPLRLGFDAFTDKEIGKERKEALLNTMHAFHLLIKAYGAEAYSACATSAMREAKNGQELIKKVKEVAGIDISIISGKEEAEIIYANHLNKMLDPNKEYLFMDVGGGSTELTLFVNGKVCKSASFNIGTIRMLNEPSPSENYEKMKRWIKSTAAEYKKIEIIGSGGNINKIFKMLGKKEGKPIMTYELQNFSDFIKSFTYEERISKLGLNPDRADVIIPATKLYLKALKWSSSITIHVPKIGVADGMIKQLYSDLIVESKKN